MFCFVENQKFCKLILFEKQVIQWCSNVSWYSFIRIDTHVYERQYVTLHFSRFFKIIWPPKISPLHLKREYQSGRHCKQMRSKPECLSKLILLYYRVTMDFLGVEAHAAEFPWEGVNALDAAILCYNNVSCMRQQLPPGWMIHGEAFWRCVWLFAWSCRFIKAITDDCCTPLVKKILKNYNNVMYW